jgi:hypothetical protein
VLRRAGGSDPRRIRYDRAAFDGDGDAREVVIPAAVVLLARLAGEIAVSQAKARPRALRFQRDLHDRRTGRHTLAVALEPPGERNVRIRYRLEKLAADDVEQVRHDTEHAAGTRVELDLGPDPLHHLRGLGEEAVDDLGRRIDVDLFLDHLSVCRGRAHGSRAPRPP